MIRFRANENDGTLLISRKLDAPMQGTLVGRDHNDLLIVGKGVIRPTIVTSDFRGEEEAFVIDAGFSKKFDDLSRLNFYPLASVRDQRCTLNRQAIYFCLEHPEDFIAHDNKRLASLDVLSLMHKEVRRKADAGLSPSLVLNAAAVWDMFNRFHVQGVRSLAIGSTLVPRTVDLSVQIRRSLSQLELTLLQKVDELTGFFIMEDTAKRLVKQLGWESTRALLHRIFLIHRDPALPDAGSLTPMMCLGTCSWSTGSAHQGLVFNPQDPNWVRMNGDFDGDYASCIAPLECMIPKRPIQRLDYRIDARKYRTDCIVRRAMQDAEDAALGLLGPVTLAAIKLVERGLMTDNLRAISAGITQGSVDAKKHAVDTDGLLTDAQLIFNIARKGSDNGARPYITELVNDLKITSTYNGKINVWARMQKNQRVWLNGASPIEQALIERFNHIHQLYTDIEFFRQQRRVQLPSAMREAAKSMADPDAVLVIKRLSEQYTATARQLAYNDNVLDKEGAVAEVRDKLRAIELQFRIAVRAGVISGCRFEPLSLQVAMVAYGPARIAARHVPASVFEILGKASKRMFLALIGHKWETREYRVDELKPIPSVKQEFDAFVKGKSSVYVTVIKSCPNSTRVMLETEK